MSRIKKLIALLMTIFMVFLMILPVWARTSCSLGIKNNGTAGIWIDVNAAPYTSFATYSMGQYAYTDVGCAWFASARVNQLTGKGKTIWSGESWLAKCGQLGFTSGSTPKAPSLMCFGNHVAVLEKIDGNTGYISEGGSGWSDYDHGYTIIRTINLSQYYIGKDFKDGSGKFLGYVYLSGTPTPSFSYVTVPEIIYRVKSKSNGQYLIVDSDVDKNHQNVSVWPLDLNNLDKKGQQWYFLSDSLGYKIGSQLGSRILNVYSDNVKSGDNVNIYDFVAGEGTQRWKLQKVNGGYVIHVQSNPNCVLTVENGHNVIVANYVEGNTAMIWELECVNHTWNSGTVTTPATYFNTGVKKYTCTVCGSTKTESTAMLALPTTPAKIASISYNGHTYFLYASNKTWTEAKAWCEKNGGYLATITSSMEQSAISSLIGTYLTNSFWLGGENDITGDFRWITCEKWSYTNWTPGEPNNTGGTEYYLGTFQGLTWNDFSNTSVTPRGFIMEVGSIDTSSAAHIWDNGSITKAATCTDTGVKTYTCVACNATKTETIPAAGHSFSGWKTTLSATEDREGIKERSCTICGITKTAVIPKLSKQPEKSAGILYGDLDRDGVITASDARSALRFAVGLDRLTYELKDISDVDKDGNVTAADARKILRAAVGLEKPEDWKK